jgi:hydroxymethylglutaryl-CoA lyase
MDMPFIETLDEAKHFLKGPSADGGISPWKAPITSPMRPEYRPAEKGAEPSLPLTVAG